MAHCNLCKKKYKHGGNTTNLRQHLTRKHPIFYTSDVSISREKSQTGSESSNDVNDNNDVDDSSKIDDTSYSLSDASSSSVVNNKRRKLESNCKVRYQNIYIHQNIYSKYLYQKLHMSLHMHKLQANPHRDVRIDTAFQRTSSFAG